MKFRNMVKFYGPGVAGFSFLGAAGSALATESAIVEAAGTAITAAKADGLTVGTYVVAAIAALVVVTLIIALVRKV